MRAMRTRRSLAVAATCVMLGGGAAVATSATNAAATTAATAGAVSSVSHDKECRWYPAHWEKVWVAAGWYCR